MSYGTSSRGLRLDPETLARWPEVERRKPPRSDRHYLVLSVLAKQIRTALDTCLPDTSDLRVLDVGCGNKPYLPFVATRAATYRGLDTQEGPLIDDVGAAEDMPYADASFDLVLCTQVLEHARHPESVVREIHRVLSPGGLALVSTHGVALYHPDPPDSDRDYWRWTHSGLAILFRDCGEWSSLEIKPNGNFVACIGYLVAQFLDEAAARIAPPVVRRVVTGALNGSAEWLDARYPPRARVPRPGSLSPNYLVVCTKG